VNWAARTRDLNLRLTTWPTWEAWQQAMRKVRTEIPTAVGRSQKAYWVLADFAMDVAFAVRWTRITEPVAWTVMVHRSVAGFLRVA